MPGASCGVPDVPGGGLLAEKVLSRSRSSTGPQERKSRSGGDGSRQFPQLAPPCSPESYTFGLAVSSALQIRSEYAGTGCNRAASDGTSVRAGDGDPGVPGASRGRKSSGKKKSAVQVQQPETGSPSAITGVETAPVTPAAAAPPPSARAAPTAPPQAPFSTL